MTRAAKRDASEPGIIAALERSGCMVYQMDRPVDLMVYRARRLYLLEVKSKGGSLTDDQEEFLAAGWPVTVVWSPEQALTAVGL